MYSCGSFGLRYFFISHPCNANNQDQQLDCMERRTMERFDCRSWSSYSKFSQCEHPSKPEDKRTSVPGWFKAVSQHSRLQRAQIWPAYWDRLALEAPINHCSVLKAVGEREVWIVPTSGIPTFTTSESWYLSWHQNIVLSKLFFFYTLYQRWAFIF